MTAAFLPIPAPSTTNETSQSRVSAKRQVRRASWGEGFYSAFPLFVIGPACIVAGALLYYSPTAASLSWSWGGSYNLRLWFIYFVLGFAAVDLGIIAIFSEVTAGAPRVSETSPPIVRDATLPGREVVVPASSPPSSPPTAAPPWDESVIATESPPTSESLEPEASQKETSPAPEVPAAVSSTPSSSSAESGMRKESRRRRAARRRSS